MCLAVAVPIVESGSAGYLGQVSSTLNGTAKATECFDCTEHPIPTSWPVCTIRNTPSTLVHCVVWAKEFVFKTVFTAYDHSEAQSGSYFEKQEANSLQRLAPLELARRLFVSGVEKVLQMSELWSQPDKKRPIPLSEAALEAAKPSNEPLTIDEHRILSLSECITLFLDSYSELSTRQMPFSFDKDDEEALNFVVSAALIRASCYHISKQ